MREVLHRQQGIAGNKSYSNLSNGTSRSIAGLFEKRDTASAFVLDRCSECVRVGRKEDQSVLDICLEGERFRQSSYADRRVK